MMRYLQKLGKALMLPVACLPICGILMGLGYAFAPAVMGAAGATEGFMYVLGFFGYSVAREEVIRRRLIDPYKTPKKVPGKGRKA